MRKWRLREVEEFVQGYQVERSEAPIQTWLLSQDTYVSIFIKPHKATTSDIWKNTIILMF